MPKTFAKFAKVPLSVILRERSDRRISQMESLVFAEVSNRERQEFARELLFQAPGLLQAEAEPDYPEKALRSLTNLLLDIKTID